MPARKINSKSSKRSPNTASKNLHGGAPCDPLPHGVRGHRPWGAPDLQNSAALLSTYQEIDCTLLQQFLTSGGLGAAPYVRSQTYFGGRSIWTEVIYASMQGLQGPILCTSTTVYCTVHALGQGRRANSPPSAPSAHTLSLWQNGPPVADPDHRAPALQEPHHQMDNVVDSCQQKKSGVKAQRALQTLHPKTCMVVPHVTPCHMARQGTAPGAPLTFKTVQHNCSCTRQ